jgi:hypothetical protein
MGIMKLLSVKIIGLKVLMVFDYDKMKIIEKGKITNLYQDVNNNLRTIYIVILAWMIAINKNIYSMQTEEFWN